MSLVKVTCKKCLESTMMDIGDMSKEDVIKALSNDKDGFHCFGHHVEFGNRIDYWTIDWNTVEEGNAPSEEDFLAKLKEQYKEVYRYDEVQHHYNIKGFIYGICTATNVTTGEEVSLSFTHSPKGTRYYFR
jgi:hypothetical protein